MGVEFSEQLGIIDCIGKCFLMKRWPFADA